MENQNVNVENENEVSTSESEATDDLSTDEYNTDNEKQKRQHQGKNNNEPPKKKICNKRLQKYKSSWENEFEWLTKDPNNIYEARCKNCNASFSVAKAGKGQVKQHENCNTHKSKSLIVNKNVLLDSYFKNHKNSSVLDQVTIAEVSLTFHSIKHNESYNSLDCLGKLITEIIPGSEISSKLHLGRTKGEAIVTDVLSPYTVEKMKEDLQDPNMFFCLQTDASNKKNRKLFPLVVQYFSPTEGIKNKVIDFYENSNESSDGMFDAISLSLKNVNLSFSKMSAFSADNCNANFGKNHSLYTNIKKEVPNLIKGNCHAHIVHNTVKHAMSCLDVDIENVILKVYSHFSVSAVRRDSLKEFSNFVDAEWHELKRHVSTRWLSLLPCIDRLYIIWKTVKSYFLSLGEDCPKDIFRILNFNEDTEVDEDEDIVEVYLCFSSHILNLFDLTIKKLEGNKITILDLFDIMMKLKNNLCKRKEDKFFGSQTRTLLNKFESKVKEKIEKNFDSFLDTALKYLNKWFDFDEQNYLNLLKCLDLKTALNYNSVEKIVQKLKLKDRLNISMDDLYTEIVNFNKIYSELSKQKEFLNLNNAGDKWTLCFKNTAATNIFKNILNIVSFLLSIPATSAFVERIFSLMKIKWREERNRCSVDLIKAELLVYFNLNVTCTDIKNHLRGDKKLLEQARSQEKYKFKGK